MSYDPDPDNKNKEQRIFAEVGAISLVALGAFIGKLLFGSTPQQAPQQDRVVVINPSSHNKIGYKYRKRIKNNETRS